MSSSASQAQVAAIRHEPCLVAMRLRKLADDLFIPRRQRHGIRQRTPLKLMPEHSRVAAIMRSASNPSSPQTPARVVTIALPPSRSRPAHRRLADIAPHIKLRVVGSCVAEHLDDEQATIHMKLRASLTQEYYRRTSARLSRNVVVELTGCGPCPPAGSSTSNLGSGYCSTSRDKAGSFGT